MKLYIPIPYKTTIAYPTQAEVEAYTETHRLAYMDRQNPDKGYHQFQYSRTVEVTTIGGINNYFLVYAYPPEGFEYADPDELSALEVYRGWILQLVDYTPTYRLDTATYLEGYTAFAYRKHELGY